MNRTIAITGSRDPAVCPDDLVRRVLDAVKPDKVHVGDCPTGADAAARAFGSGHTKHGCTVHRADWKKHGNAAGPIRNRAMVRAAIDDGAAFIVVFPGGKGTRNAENEAERAGLLQLVVLPGLDHSYRLLSMRGCGRKRRTWRIEDNVDPFAVAAEMMEDDA